MAVVGGAVGGGAVGGRARSLRVSFSAMLGRRSTASEVEAPALHLLPPSAAAVA